MNIAKYSVTPIMLDRSYFITFLVFSNVDGEFCELYLPQIDLLMGDVFSDLNNSTQSFYEEINCFIRVFGG